ncbi:MULTISPECIES: hypothetical protein [Staphylococcus]|jgi:uncharacterized protein YxeA|uniref:hypothetical protein n=1 Tax=Staphylococcus saprophyticus TaxID=29385 RepID=UPI001C92D4BF|nr:hypothetical protein [Staphylococcus saprophyticus]MBZ6405541.1 hypothetical protein [Staphylococcus saprophyticus]MBZ6447965.1 hypothetical protein [Staphylococcus saprophyticus]
MKKLLVALSILAVIVVLAAAGVFGYSKYKEVEMKQQNLETQLEEKNSNEQTNENDQQQEQANTNESQNQENSSTKNNNDNKQKVSRDNVFDYALAAINEVGDADLMKFQEPSYSDGVWTIDANNKSGSGSNTIKVYDDGWVQIYDGSGEIAHETKIKL